MMLLTQGYQFFVNRYDKYHQLPKIKWYDMMFTRANGNMCMLHSEKLFLMEHLSVNKALTESDFR